MTSTAISYFFSQEFPKKLDKAEIIEIDDPAKASDWYEAMAGANINIFEISCRKLMFPTPGECKIWRK
jgi:hypothetical protein